MASIVADILNDIVDTLRSISTLGPVTLGESGSATEIPRAGVLYKGQESLPPDDATGVQWFRIRAIVSIRTRSIDDAEAVSRINELCELAADALLQDRFRGARCQDLPIGLATEIRRNEMSQGIRRPEVEMTLDIQCHFQTVEVS